MSATIYRESASEIATLSNVFSVGGVPTDPTTISLTVTDPTGTATAYTYALSQLTRTGTGAYSRDVTCSAPGVWTYLWVGTGTVSDATAGTWTVSPAAINQRYCSVEEVKSRLNITDTRDDFELELAVESASRWIDTYCNRRFWRGAATRTYAAMSPRALEVDDLVSVTTLATDLDRDGVYETTWSTSDYQLAPVNPAAETTETRPYDLIRAIGSQAFPVASPYGRQELVQVAGVFGWPAVPAPVRQAALVLSSETFKLKDAPFGVAGYGEFGVVRLRDNPMLRSMLDPYRRYRILVA